MHKQKVFAGGRDKAQFYQRLAEKLGIENNFVLHMQHPKTYEWSEFEHMFPETTGPENERRGRLVRDEDNWFPMHPEGPLRFFTFVRLFSDLSSQAPSRLVL